MTWQIGQAEIEAMLTAGQLESVSADRALAEELLETSRRHLTSARAVLKSDPEGSFQLAYDAARMALTAHLQNQGLRAKSGEGGHRTVHLAASAQLGSTAGAVLDDFDWLRRTRNDTEYPRPDRRRAAGADAEAIEVSEQVVEKLSAVLAPFPVFVASRR